MKSDATGISFHKRNATGGGGAGDYSKQTGLPERTGIDVSLADADFLCTAYAFSSDKSEEPDIVKSPQNMEIFNIHTIKK